MHKTFIIAEAGVNHNGSMQLAKELIDAAASAGADAVKFQTFKADQLLLQDTPKAEYQIAQTPDSTNQFDMLQKLELSLDDHYQLSQYCRSKKIQFLSTPFDLESANVLLNQLKLRMIKIASGEMTNTPLLLKIARANKPVILSTGMSTLADIEFALSVLAFGYSDTQHLKPNKQHFYAAYRSQETRRLLRDRVLLLHCTSDYPAAYQEVNLKAMETLRHAFNLAVGYSDHTLGIEIPIAAVARGAVLIEKHFTLDRTLPGPDHQASLDPINLKLMVDAIRHVEIALGDGCKIPTESEYKNRSLVRKSLVALREIRQGEVFTESNLGLKRPGAGICGNQYWDWIGQVAQRDFIENDLIA